MKKIILVATSWLLMASCTQKTCDLQNNIAGALSATVSTALSCKNDVAVKADIEKVLNSVGTCSSNQRMIGICDIVVPTLVDTTIGSAVPAKWECSSTQAKELLKSVMIKACEKVI